MRREREFVVGGWAEGAKGGIGSLAIGYVEADGLRYVGQVGSGLSGKLAHELEAAFARYRRDESPFVNTPKVPPLQFVAPLLVVQVAFAEVTQTGTLRHPVLLGIRNDVLPTEVVWDDELR